MIRATLIMDSRTNPETLRSQNIAAAWSRVYKAEQYYIDLDLKATHHSAVLMGQILPVNQGLSGSSIDLKAPDGKVLEHFPLGKAGDFRCTLAYPGIYELEVCLSDCSFLVPVEV